MPKKGIEAPIITKDDKEPEDPPSKTPRKQSKRINGSTSPRSAGIAAAAPN